MSNIIPFERKRPPPVRGDFTSPIIMWCVGIGLMQMAALTMIANLWDDR